MLAPTTPLSLGMSTDYGLLSSYPLDARLTGQFGFHRVQTCNTNTSPDNNDKASAETPFFNRGINTRSAGNALGAAVFLQQLSSVCAAAINRTSEVADAAADGLINVTKGAGHILTNLTSTSSEVVVNVSTTVADALTTVAIPSTTSLVTTASAALTHATTVAATTASTLATTLADTTSSLTTTTSAILTHASTMASHAINQAATKAAQAIDGKVSPEDDGGESIMSDPKFVVPLVIGIGLATTLVGMTIQDCWKKHCTQEVDSQPSSAQRRNIYSGAKSESMVSLPDPDQEQIMVSSHREGSASRGEHTLSSPGVAANVEVHYKNEAYEDLGACSNDEVLFTSCEKSPLVEIELDEL
ncbi:hypothetical protein [Endozoicomonas elysicola]|uniref:Uncharacterized protein n=1 Tax=Endozoicomonas elysicola TaxID=305900 RepID=A0A081K911_9GAMM|nr:hypothetical protein [Endozoicomonas elysicola]KEI70637.1 hypothetical protein GV64_07680 [Endozoicomonas elysicola]